MANFIRDRSQPRRHVDRKADGSVQAVVTRHFKTDRQDVNVHATPVRVRVQTQETQQ